MKKYIVNYCFYGRIAGHLEVEAESQEAAQEAAPNLLDDIDFGDMDIEDSDFHAVEIND